MLNDVFMNQDCVLEVDIDVVVKDNILNFFKGYIFVCKKYIFLKCVVFVNIKVCDIIFEKVKEDIVSWCYNKNVNVFSIFFLVNYFV